MCRCSCQYRANMPLTACTAALYGDLLHTSLRCLDAGNLAATEVRKYAYDGTSWKSDCGRVRLGSNGMEDEATRKQIKAIFDEGVLRAFLPSLCAQGETESLCERTTEA